MLSEFVWLSLPCCTSWYPSSCIMWEIWIGLNPSKFIIFSVCYSTFAYGVTRRKCFLKFKYGWFRCWCFIFGDCIITYNRDDLSRACASSPRYFVYSHLVICRSFNQYVFVRGEAWEGSRSRLDSRKGSPIRKNQHHTTRRALKLVY